MSFERGTFLVGCLLCWFHSGINMSFGPVIHSSFSSGSLYPCLQVQLDDGFK